MNLESKDYKLKKLEKYFCDKKLFFVFNSVNLKSENWIFIEQEFKKQNLKYIKLKNNLAIKVLKKSILKNLTALVNGPVILIEPVKLENVNFKKLIKINSNFYFISLKLNNKIYSKSQLKELKSLNYLNNLTTFQKCLRKCVKIPFKKFLNSK